MGYTQGSRNIGEPQFGSPEEAQKYADWIVSFQNRPLDFALTMWRWGEGELANRKLEDWQWEMLHNLQVRLLADEANELEAARLGKIYNAVYRYARPAGHGVGKTAGFAMLIHWFASCHPHSEGVVTASTEAQLQSKTWRELRKWQLIALNGWMFEWSATKYKHRGSPETWFMEAKSWSESNPSSFAGTHEKYVFIGFDESSGIHHLIWEAVEGALTTGKCFFFAFGNPVEPTGGFFDVCHKFKHRWDVATLDARSVSFANLEEIENWKNDWGEDSDFFRVRVRGEFPRTAANQFIEQRMVAAARKRSIDWRDVPRAHPRLMGVDVARQGGDRNVIVLRQGRKMAPRIIRFYDRDLMNVANTVARHIREMKPDIVYIDEVGIGAGVVDRLIQMGYDMVVGVQSGSKDGFDDRDKKIYGNLRALMWTRMRNWMHTADIPDDPELETDLCGPTCAYQTRTNLILVESKDDMRARGLASPDIADALAMTFSELAPTRQVGSRSAEPDAV